MSRDICKVDSSGSVSFAAASYRAGNAYIRRQVQVAVVAGTVENSVGEELFRVHPIRHNRTREHGALANPGGRPHRINAASQPLAERRTSTGIDRSHLHGSLTDRQEL